MIGVNDLKLIVKLVLLSGYIKNAEPLNLMLISDAGQGKTEIISSFVSPRITLRSDLDYPTLIKLLDEKKAIKHIILPDFLKITMKKRSSSNNLISLLNASIEEGLNDINLMNKTYNFKNRRIGLISATTKQSFAQHKREWLKIGFMSRMILVSYSYSDEVLQKIIDYINSEKFFKREPVTALKGYKDVFIEPKLELNRQLNEIADKKLRSIKQLQTLTKCNALNNGRTKIIQEDIDEIIRLSKFFNLKFTPI